MRGRTTVTLSVVSVIEVNQLRWYGYVLRKSEDKVVRQAWEVPVKGERSRGRQPRRWSDGFAEDTGGAWFEGRGHLGPQEMEK